VEVTTPRRPGQNPLFGLRVREWLVFSRCEIISSIPLDGGFRNNVSSVLKSSGQPNWDCSSSERTLSKAASKAGVRGTFVGMITAGDARACFPNRNLPKWCAVHSRRFEEIVEIAVRIPGKSLQYFNEGSLS